MIKKLLATSAAIGITGIGLIGLAPTATATDGAPINCVAQAGTSCVFSPVNPESSADGYISATDGEFTITGADATCTIDNPTSTTTGIPDDGVLSNGDTVYTNSGPGIGGLVFVEGCHYTLAVSGAAGAVTAGETD